LTSPNRGAASTFKELTMKNFMFMILILLNFNLPSGGSLFAGPAAPADVIGAANPEARDAVGITPDMIYRNVGKAMDRGDVRESDFWMAGYMALEISGESGHAYAGLIPFFEKRENLRKPVSFISGQYSEEFLDFFFRGTYAFWEMPENVSDEKNREFMIRANHNGEYFAQIAVTPYLESWVIIREKNMQKRVIPFGDFIQPPVIVAGTLKQGVPEKFFDKHVLEIGEHPLHYVWPIEFHDIDGDGVPEIWTRYNAAWADGFSQVLDIYKIKNGKELVLLKKFEGQAEGIARRLADGKIEVGYGTTDKDGVGHLGYDRHRIETWEYKNGDFVKISERNVPHLLIGNEWKQYYFENQE